MANMNLEEECKRVTKKAFETFKHNIINAPFEVLPQEQDNYLQIVLKMLKQDVTGGIGMFVFENNLKGINEAFYKEKYYNIAKGPAVVFAKKFYKKNS